MRGAPYAICDGKYAAFVANQASIALTSFRLKIRSVTMRR
jgi:hypothetical protein